MSRRRRQAYWARQSEPQRAYERWFFETIAKAPRMPHPLPGEIEGGWDIYRILEEIERLRPSVEAARKEWFARRRAEMPPEVKEWAAASIPGLTPDAPSPPQRAPLPSSAPRAPRSTPTMTPEEKRQRKLEQTRESNARKRAERKAAGLPYK